MKRFLTNLACVFMILIPVVYSDCPTLTKNKDPKIDDWIKLDEDFLGNGNFGKVYADGDEKVIKEVENNWLNKNEIEVLKKLNGLDRVLKYFECAKFGNSLYLKLDRLHKPLSDRKVIGTIRDFDSLAILKAIQDLFITLKKIHKKM